MTPMDTTAGPRELAFGTKTSRASRIGGVRGVHHFTDGDTLMCGSAKFRMTYAKFRQEEKGAAAKGRGRRQQDVEHANLAAFDAGYCRARGYLLMLLHRLLFSLITMAFLGCSWTLAVARRHHCFYGTCALISGYSSTAFRRRASKHSPPRSRRGCGAAPA